MKTEERQRHPLYSEPVPRWWWMKTPPFRRFVLRELTSLFVALFSVILLLFLFALSRGPDQYYGFLDWLDLPVVAILGIITLVAVLYHTATSIELASMIQEVRLGEKKIPRQSVMIGMAAGWIVVSVVIALIHLEL